MTTSFFQAFSLQGRVLWALMLREIHGKQGKSRLGYLWQINKTAFGIAVFWGVRHLTHGQAPQGLPMPIFLLMGFIPWYIFSEIVARTMEAVNTNLALLTFPQITPLDLFLSSALVVWVTEVVIMLLFLVVFHFAGYSFVLLNPLGLFTTLVGLGLFAFGLGLILTACARYLPVVEKIVPMVMRLLFFASGIFFSPRQVAGRLGDAILWNPLTGFIELCRSFFILPTPPQDIKITFILCLTVFFIGIGLLLERHIRSVQVHL